jgi:hypothetical protein
MKQLISVVTIGGINSYDLFSVVGKVDKEK